MTKPELLMLILPLKALLECGKTEEAIQILSRVVREVETKPGGYAQDASRPEDGES